MSQRVRRRGRLSSAVVDFSKRRARLSSRVPELDTQAFFVNRLPNVRYLTGFSGSNGQLILTADGGIFLTDGRYAEQSRREVPDLERRIYMGELVPTFAEACADLGIRRVAFEAGGVTYSLYTQLGDAGVELVPTDGEVERLRWVKEGEEIERVDRAQAIADEAFHGITGKLLEGVTEREAALDLDVTMRALGANGVAFETIVAFGENAAEPHHEPTDRPLAAGDIVKMDFGCVVDGYHSDMTRTLAVGEPKPRLREVYEVVRKAQQAGVDAVRAGVTGGEVDRVVRGIVADAGYGDQFRHGLGHGVGLEIHEGPSLRHGGQDVLPQGAVVTIEPGVYLEHVGGVRIEDMVEVLADGCRVIPSTPKDLILL
jgi:Xaa-Pro aminopeptidase